MIHCYWPSSKFLTTNIIFVMRFLQTIGRKKLLQLGEFFMIKAYFHSPTMQISKLLLTGFRVNDLVEFFQMVCFYLKDCIWAVDCIAHKFWE